MTIKEVYDFLKQYIDKKVGSNREELRDLFIQYKTKEVGENINAIRNLNDNIDNISDVNNNIDNIITVGSNIDKIISVESKIAEIENIDNNMDHIEDIGNNISKIINVNDNLDKVSNVENSLDSIENVSQNMTKILTVEDNIDNINNIEAVLDDIENVSNNIDKITTVNDNINDIVIVSSNINDVLEVKDNINIISNVENHIDEIIEVRSRYLGTFDTDPTSRYDGSVLQVGDYYFNTVDLINKTWNGNTWVTPDNVATVQDVNNALQDALDQIEESGSTMIVKPSIVSPNDGETDFAGQIQASSFETLELFYGQHEATDWEFSKQVDFSTIEANMSIYNDTVNLTSINLSSFEPLTTYYVRVRYRSDNHISLWSDPISFTTLDAYIETPVITVEGEPDDVNEIPLITGSSFVVVNGTDVHQSTDWILKDNNGNTVWESLNDTTNLTSIELPSGILQTSSTYTIEVVYHGSNYTSSVGSKTFTTKDIFGAPFDILGDGSCIALYEFEGNANDTGGIYNGTWNNNEQYNAGKIGQGAKFDGNNMGLNSYNAGINLPNSLVRYKTVFTLSCWIKGRGCILQTDYHGAISFATGWAILTDSIVKCLSRYSRRLFRFDPPNSNIFNHFLVVFNHGGNTKVYINSVLVAEGNTSGDIYYDGRYYADTGTNLGAAYESSFTGIIDQVRIFNRALTDDEVQYIYNVENQGA